MADNSNEQDHLRNPAALPDPDDVALAAFIIACLLHEGYVILHLEHSESRQDYVNSIRLTATVLSLMRAPDGNPPALPFDW